MSKYTELSPTVIIYDDNNEINLTIDLNNNPWNINYHP